jgi:hypothetical protein
MPQVSLRPGDDGASSTDWLIDCGLKPYLAGIIASARYHLNTSILEGMNNRIKAIKRMATATSTPTAFSRRSGPPFPTKRDSQKKEAGRSPPPG